MTLTPCTKKDCGVAAFRWEMKSEIYNIDCMKMMAEMLDDQSVDAIIADPPYETTGMVWDKAINIDQMWVQLKRIIRPKRAIVLFGNQPFTSRLILGNPKWFKYCWIWEKSKGTGFFNAKNAPIAYHEEIAVFSNGTTANRSPLQMSYFPQGLKDVKRARKNYNKGTVGARPSRMQDYTQTVGGYPKTILRFPNDGTAFHPTQKPIELMRYLVRTYTSAGETVLDFTMGSGSTGVACAMEGRRFIGVEKDVDYFNIATKRLKQVCGLAISAAESETQGALF